MKQLSIKHYVTLAILIFIFNAQGIFSINYYFPGAGTILLVMALVAYFIKPSVKFIIMWTIVSPIIYWLSETALSVTGLGGSFLTFQFIPVLVIVILGILTKQIFIVNNWVTYTIFAGDWVLDMVFTSVRNMQANGLSEPPTLLPGQSILNDPFIVNRFLFGIVFVIEICSILTLIKFPQRKENSTEVSTS